jgi:hypothetical protein
MKASDKMYSDYEKKTDKLENPPPKPQVKKRKTS